MAEDQPGTISAVSAGQSLRKDINFAENAEGGSSGEGSNQAGCS